MLWEKIKPERGLGSEGGEGLCEGWGEHAMGLGMVREGLSEGWSREV